MLKPVESRLSTDHFSCLPHEIYALRKSLKWSRVDLGTFVGASLDLGGKRCKSVGNWERGYNKPFPVFRARLAHLAELYEDRYLEYLRQYSPGPKRHLLVPYRKTERHKWRYKRLSPEMQEKMNAESRTLRAFEAVKVPQKA